MKPQQFLAGGTALVFVLALAVGLSQAQSPRPEQVSMPLASVGSAFTYQGYLMDGGNPASGAYDFQFILYDAPSGGSQVGSIVATDNVTITNGLFTVALDFGTVFDGTRLWLDVAVRPGSSTGDYTILSPRQEITPAPYALYAVNIPAHGHFGETWSGSAANGLASVSTASSGTANGIWGEAYSSSGRGVYGRASATSGTATGVYGRSNSLDGYGGYFMNSVGGVDVAAMGSGIIKSSADTQIVVSPFDLRAWSGGVSAAPDERGYVYLQASASGSQEVLLPVTLPARVFGAPQKLKSIKVCYQLDNASSYIDKTEAYHVDDSAGRTYFFEDDTDRTSISWTCYTVDDSTPDPIQGTVVVRFWLDYAGTGDAHEIVIGNITLTLTEN